MEIFLLLEEIAKGQDLLSVLENAVVKYYLLLTIATISE
jgi:hypothetical protein